MEKDDGQTGLVRQEWARAPLLPFAGLVGHATAVFHINGFSPFIVPISEDFGWSRTLTTMGDPGARASGSPAMANERGRGTG